MIVGIGQDRVELRDLSLLGSGGEAEVYALGESLALKIYKSPQHRDFANDSAARMAAAARLATVQDKLRAFPVGLPPQVLGPVELAVDPAGLVVGFVMPRAVGAMPWFSATREARLAQRDARGIGSGRLLRLGRTLRRLHRHGVVVGDLSDLNLLVAGDQVFVIDADSFQFASFKASVFNPRFCDPLALETSGQGTSLSVNTDSDWYAFAVLVMLTLLGVHPYGGVAHRVGPSGGRTRLEDAQRIRERVSVFAAGVTYPRSADGLGVLPGALRDHLAAMFQTDLRGEFPLELLERARWSTCAACRLEHAAAACPGCAATGSTMAAPISPSIAAGLLVRTVVRTPHPIWVVSLNAGALVVSCRLDESVVGVDGKTIWPAPLLPQKTVRLLLTSGREAIWGAATEPHLVLIGAAAPSPREVIRVDVHEGNPAIAFAGTTPMWMSAGVIWRRGVAGAERVLALPSRRGRLISGETIWGALVLVGSALVACVGATTRKSAVDGIVLDPGAATGEPLDLGGVSGDTLLWVSWRRRATPNTLDLACVSADGKIIARDSTEGAIARAALAVGDVVARGFAHGRDLFVPTDDGIARITAAPDGTMVIECLADTASLVTARHQLAPGQGCIYASDSHEVIELRRHAKPSTKGLRS